MWNRYQRKSQSTSPQSSASDSRLASVGLCVTTTLFLGVALAVSEWCLGFSVLQLSVFFSAVLLIEGLTLGTLWVCRQLWD